MNGSAAQEFLRNWEIAGTGFIIVSGSILHSVFGLTGRWPPMALIAAVNESVWEHLKLVFWPAFIFALVSYPVIRGKTENFFLAKSAAILAMPLIIAVLHYSYVWIFRHHNLAFDIGIFFGSAILGQMLCFRLLLKPRFPLIWQLAAAVLLLAATSAFSLLSYHPPRWPIFREAGSGRYGLQDGARTR